MGQRINVCFLPLPGMSAPSMYSEDGTIAARYYIYIYIYMYIYVKGQVFAIWTTEI
jgi:hypothetical protein